MKQNTVAQQQALRIILLALGRTVLVAILPAALCICLATTTCPAAEWFGMDQSPRQIAANLWHFSINLGVRPVGHMQFVWSQYDFAWDTRGFAVVYDFNPGRLSCADPRRFLSIAPTLFDPVDGYMHGWNATDLNDGTFSGVVYATAPLTTVYFLIEADRFVRVRLR